MEQLLALLKNDLGIKSTSKDDYFNKYLESRKKELEDKGISFDLESEDNIDDLMLISDYAAWMYRNRSENTSIPNNLLNRIRNKVTKKRSSYGIV